VSVAVFGLLFFSPLGSIFFAVTNSLFLLAIGTPLLLFVAFQVWHTFFVIKAPCPSCGAPVAVMKGSEQTTGCFNCGATIRPTADSKGVEMCNQAPDFTRGAGGGRGGEGGVRAEGR